MTTLVPHSIHHATIRPVKHILVVSVVHTLVCLLIAWVRARTFDMTRSSDMTAKPPIKLSELLSRKGKTKPSELAKEFGITAPSAKISDAEQFDCVVGKLVIAGRLQLESDPSSAFRELKAAITEVGTSVQHVAAQTVELTRSLEHTQAVQDDHSKSLTAIQAPVRVLADRRAEPGLEHTGLIVSGVAEEVRGKDLQEHMQSLLQDEIETETPVSVCEVRRIGESQRGPEQAPQGAC